MKGEGGRSVGVGEESRTFFLRGFLGRGGFPLRGLTFLSKAERVSAIRKGLEISD